MKLYIGENLKKLRNDRKVTQDALAEYLGVSFQAVSRWENGSGCPDRHGSASSQPIHNISHDLPLR